MTGSTSASTPGATSTPSSGAAPRTGLANTLSHDAGQPYQYVALRAVPRVEREEFVNVGVLLYSQAANVLTCSWHLDEGRLLALHPQLDLQSLEGMLRQLELVCAGDAGAGRPDLVKPGARFGWLAAPRSTILQPGPMHGGVSADPQAEVVRLRERLVGA